MERAQKHQPSSQPSVSAKMPGVKRLQGCINLRSLHATNPQRYPYLLESTAQSENTQYSLLFAFPEDFLILDAKQQLSYNDKIITSSNNFLQQLDIKWQQERERHDSVSDLPFSGGWFLFLGYELAQQVEPRLSIPMPTDGFPVACAVRIPAAVIVDHKHHETILVTEKSGNCDFLKLLEEDIDSLKELGDKKETASKFKINVCEENPVSYIDNVAKVKQYIINGDVFQVNLSRRWSAPRPQNLTPYTIYRNLSETNPAPFSGIMQFPFGAIISSSPERLLNIKEGIANTRPIAGTRPRSTDNDDDNAYKNELIGHPKERAEHIMLIDLERNDLGRVCEPGSVVVDELMALESYAHVHHIVSNVTGKLRKEVTPGEAIKAVFPGGTITGCPKERCMAIIAELEQEARGAYTGSVGYLNHSGNMDLNILIRTITVTDKEVRFRAGAGLVFDSVAEKELEETRHKAKGMLLALGVASD
ncbi:MAG: aminodeoxychorismate synthase component I [Gammaproteobacteria bacterium]